MKKLSLVLLVLFLVLTSSSMVLAALNQFAGRWINTDPNTRGVTMMDIRVSGSNATVEAWGKAHPSDINWGRATATAYGPDVSGNLATSARTLVAVYDNNFSKKFMVIRSEGRGRLEAEVFTSFTDNSGRSNYSVTYSFIRFVPTATPMPTLPPMLVPTATKRPHHDNNDDEDNGHDHHNDHHNLNPTQAPNYSLTTPIQTAPGDGASISGAFRFVTFTWAAVPGAVSYMIEVDYFNGTDWLKTQGKTYILEPVKTTAYKLRFIDGHSLGRWRVWAIGANGEASPKSDWWKFKCEANTR